MVRGTCSPSEHHFCFGGNEYVLSGKGFDLGVHSPLVGSSV